MSSANRCRAIARRVVERLRPPALLATHEVDRASVDEGEDPRAGLRALGRIRGRRAPHREKPLLDGVLGEPVVAEHPKREPVGHPTDPVVQLRERRLVATGDECHECFVGEMRERLTHCAQRR